MTKRTLILTDDDDPPWSRIRPPWPRIANPYRYLRAELARVICHDSSPTTTRSSPSARSWTRASRTRSRLRGLCARDDVIVSLKCSEGHVSDEIIEAILDQLEEQE